MVYLCKTLLAAVLMLGLHSQSAAAQSKCNYPGDAGTMTSHIMGKGIGAGDVAGTFAAGVDSQMSSWTVAQITSLLSPGTCAAEALTSMEMTELCSTNACWAKPFNAGFTAASKNINHTPAFFSANCKTCGKPGAAGGTTKKKKAGAAKKGKKK